jgi:glutamate-1-semialdehyde 2,1-aminomutase
MYQAGTLSGNPVTMAAGIATLEELRNPEIWNHIEHMTTRLGDEVCAVAKDAGIKVVVQQVGTMFTTFFTGSPVKDWSSAKLADISRYAEFFRLMLEEGVYLAPSQFEAGFLSSVHGNREIEKSIKAVQIAFHRLSKR